MIDLKIYLGQTYILRFSDFCLRTKPWSLISEWKKWYNTKCAQQVSYAVLWQLCVFVCVCVFFLCV